MIQLDNRWYSKGPPQSLFFHCQHKSMESNNEKNNKCMIKSRFIMPAIGALLVLLDDEQELVQNFAHANKIIQDTKKLPDFTFPEAGFNWEHSERYYLSQALNINQGNKTKAAKYLQMSYKAFLYRLEKYQIIV